MIPISTSITTVDVVMIDVGINSLENVKLVGDTDFESVSKKC